MTCAAQDTGQQLVMKHGGHKWFNDELLIQGLMINTKSWLTTNGQQMIINTKNKEEPIVTNNDNGYQWLDDGSL